MKKARRKLLKRVFLSVLAGVAAVMVAKETPAMVRYYKMKRL